MQQKGSRTRSTAEGGGNVASSATIGAWSAHCPSIERPYSRSSTWELRGRLLLTYAVLTCTNPASFRMARANSATYRVACIVHYYGITRPEPQGCRFECKIPRSNYKFFVWQ